MQNKLIVFFFISMFPFSGTVSGQKLINSPYSRFNLGTLQPTGSFRSLGMGGVGTAMRDNSSISFTNPASYSSIDTNSFVFDFGIDYGRNSISDSSTTYSSGDLNFQHLIMGFPLTKGWGIAAGVIPVSSGYYKISGEITSSDPRYDPNIGAYIEEHSGDGGITKFFIGTGIRITKNLSIGANLSLLSGQLTRTNQFVFSDFFTVFHNKSTEKLELRGVNFDYGIQYTSLLKKNYFLNTGISYTSGNNYSSKYNELSIRYTAFNVTDTISYTSNNSAKTFIPATLRFGVSFGKKDKFTTGIDFIKTRWSASTIPGSKDYAADTRELLIGAEFIPDKFSNFGILNRIEYRIGGHIGDNYLVINQEQIKEYGASIGIGIPIKRTATKINLFFDYSRKTGSLSKIHSEDYFTMGFSLNFYDDLWFLKRKYD
jgi:hypothetical protein